MAESLPPPFVANVVQHKPPNSSGSSEYATSVHQTISGMPEYLSASFEEHRLALYSGHLKKDWWSIPKQQEEFTVPEELLIQQNMVQVSGPDNSGRVPQWMVCCTEDETQSFEERRLAYYREGKEAHVEPPTWTLAAFRAGPDNTKDTQPERSQLPNNT